MKKKDICDREKEREKRREICVRERSKKVHDRMVNFDVT